MLRSRLMLGLMCLLIILLAMGLYSISQCGELGHRIAAISRDNNQAGGNLHQMKRSGAAMTGALLTLVTGDPERSAADFTEAGKNFEAALKGEEARHSASDKEKKLIANLRDAYKTYEAKTRAF